MHIVNNLIFFCIYFCFTLITCHNLFHTFFATKKVHLYGLFFNIFPIPALAKQPTSGNKHKQLRCIFTLSEPADLNRNIDQLQSRLNNNVLVQEGEEPAEDPQKLKEMLDESIARLAYLIKCINQTNCQTIIDGKSLTELIAQKDALSLKIHAYKDIVYTAAQSVYRARNTEIKIKQTINVASWQAEIDQMAKNLRLLDNKLQENNWQTDLIE